MGQHRNASELLAELKEREAQIMARMGKELASENPEVQAIEAEKREIEKSLLKFNRWLDPETGNLASIAKFEERILQHQANIERAKEERPALLQSLAEVNNRLQSKRAEVVSESLKEGEESM